MQGHPIHGWLDHWIGELAAAQHGVVSWAQLRDAGVSRGAVDFRLAVGRLAIVRKGVYSPAKYLIRPEGHWLAATMSLGDAAVLSHRSAAALHGLLPAASRIHVTLQGRGGRRGAGLVLHRSVDVEQTVVRGIPVTTPARTLLDLAATVSPQRLDEAVARAETLRLFDLTAIERVLAAGRPGTTALRDAVAAYDDAPVRSELERRFLRLCARHGLPRPEVNVPVAGLEVDFLWRDARVVVETDGRYDHGATGAFERDRARDATLLAAGYRTARFTWRQVTRQAATVAAAVSALLSAPTSRGPASPALH